MFEKLKRYIECLWMDELYDEQREYEKSRCLFPNDGSDWRRLK